MEPGGRRRRQSSDMTRHQPLPEPDPHTRHDLELIAAAAAGDLEGAELVKAQELIATCSACSELAADLRSLAAAVRVLPPPAPAPRDFRLSPEAAANLAGGGRWRRLLQSLGSRSSALRPVSTVLTTLGVAALLLAAVQSLPLGFGGATGAAPLSAPTAAASIGTTAEGAPVPPASAPAKDQHGTAAPAIGPNSTDGRGGATYDGALSGATTAPVTAGPVAIASSPPSPTVPGVAPAAPVDLHDTGGTPAGPSALAVLGVVLLVAGITLLLLRRAAPRLR
jgi:hypothetical protein